jgi:tetratricopeptide (TPR) repeat protein
MKKSLSGLICLAALSAFAAGAAAQEQPSPPPTPGEAGESTTAKVERLYLEGVALYKDSKFRLAIERFDEAYALFPDPNLLYNAGRSHEALGELNAALARFKRCAESPDVSAELKLKAEKRQEAIQAAQARSAAVEEPPEEPQVAAQQPGPEGRPAVTPPPPAEEGSSTLGILKWTTAAGALGLLGTGGVFFALGAGDHASLEDAISEGTGGVSSLTRQEAEQLAQDGEDRKTLGVILMGAGGGLAAASVLLFVLDGEEEAAPSGAAVQVKPLLWEGGAAVMVGGQF